MSEECNKSMTGKALLEEALNEDDNKGVAGPDCGGCT